MRITREEFRVKFRVGDSYVVELLQEIHTETGNADALELSRKRYRQDDWIDIGDDVARRDTLVLVMYAKIRTEFFT